MSRIGRLPINVPDKVKVQIDGQAIKISGPLGNLNLDLHPAITAKAEGKSIILSRNSDSREVRSLHGLSRSLLFNIVKGVTEGYRKSLDIIGTGYRAAMEGKNLSVQAGFSHPVLFPIPDGIKIDLETTADKQTRVKISGADKQLVGEIAAKLRRIRKPEPYKGKGIRYTDERVRRKVGKTTA
jgi:large subunit ribosomal protein L6